MANIIVARVSKENIGNVPITDGQLIFTKNSNEIFMDMGTTPSGARLKMSDVIGPIDITALTNGVEGKLYINSGDNAIYVWTSTGFKKAESVNAVEVIFSAEGFDATTIHDALLELNNKKVDKTVAGTGEKITKSYTLTGNENGLNIANIQLSLEDGTTTTINTAITLSDMGAAAETVVATLAETVAEKANQADVNTALSTKVNKSDVGTIVQNVTLTPNASNGFDYTVTKINTVDNQTSTDTGSINASDLGVALNSDINGLQGQIDAIRGGQLRFNIDFQEVFDTDTPTKTQVDNYITGLGLTPAVGTSVKNSNTSQSTYNHSFVYYTDPNNPPNGLILVDDGVDSISVATTTTIGAVRGGATGDLNISVDGDMTLKNGVITYDRLDVTLQNLIDGKVDKTVTINGYTLDKNVTLSASDINYDVNTTVAQAIANATSELTDKMDKVPTATQNHIATFDNSGQVQDGGAVIPDTTVFIPKVQNATQDHIALLNTDGTIKDSGKTLDNLSIQWIDGDAIT